MGTAHYGRAYEIKIKTFNVGDIVLFAKESFPHFFVFEVAEVQNDTALVPVAGSVVAVNRDSTKHPHHIHFTVPGKHPEKFMVENCRRLLKLDRGKFSSWVHMNYPLAGYDESLLYHYQIEGDGI